MWGMLTSLSPPLSRKQNRPGEGGVKNTTADIHMCRYTCKHTVGQNTLTWQMGLKAGLKFHYSANSACRSLITVMVTAAPLNHNVWHHTLPLQTVGPPEEGADGGRGYADQGGDDSCTRAAQSRGRWEWG